MTENEEIKWRLSTETGQEEEKASYQKSSRKKRHYNKEYKQKQKISAGGGEAKSTH